MNKINNTTVALLVVCASLVINMALDVVVVFQRQNDGRGGFYCATTVTLNERLNQKGKELMEKWGFSNHRPFESGSEKNWTMVNEGKCPDLSILADLGFKVKEGERDSEAVWSRSPNLPPTIAGNIVIAQYSVLISALIVIYWLSKRTAIMSRY